MPWKKVDPWYHADPNRPGAGADVSRFLLPQVASDVHPDIAARLDAEGAAPVLDLGAGSGALVRELTLPVVGVDIAEIQLRKWDGRRAIADAVRLPFADASFGAAAAVYMLYHVDDPTDVVREAHRVLCPGGLFAVCLPAHDNDPEVAHLVPPTDEVASEDIPELVDGLFEGLEMHPWDMPCYRMESEQDVYDYLSAMYPFIAEDARREAAALADKPLTITKRGAWAVARKRDAGDRRRRHITR